MYNSFYPANHGLTFAGQLPNDASTSNTSTSNDFDFVSQLSVSNPPSPSRMYDAHAPHTQNESFSSPGFYPPQISLMDQGMPILALPNTPDQHSRGVHINTQLPAEWASMSLQVPSYGASRASPVPITRRSSNRHHPYLAPAPTYRGRLSRSLSSELSQPAPPYPAPIPISQSMSHIEQHPTYLSVPAYNYPATPATPPTPTIIITPSTPRRVRIPQSFAPGRSRRHPAYTVRFKVDGAAGFRVGDALADQSFAVDNPDDVVLETCVDRKGHLQVDLPALPGSGQSIEQRGSYLNLQREVEVDKTRKEYHRYTRRDFAVEVARALQRAAEQNKKLGLRQIPYEDFWITYATRGSMNKWVVGLERVE